MSDFERQAGKQVFAVRPLTKGMFRDRAGQMIEDGGFWTIRNGIAGPHGIYRRPAFFAIADDDTFRDNAVDARTWIQSSGTAIEVFFTESTVYDMSKLGGLIEIPFAYTTGTVATADGNTITGTSTVWQSATDWNAVMPGDYFKLDGNTDVVKISAVNSATEIELESTYADTSFTGAAYTIYRGFRVENTKYLVDTVVANDRMVFLSKFLPPVEMNTAGDALGYLQKSAGDTVIDGAHFTAVTGAYFNERLYLGHVEEYDSSVPTYNEYRQRIRFSTATDFGNFDGTGSGYIDLDYTRGAIKAIRTMGNLLAVYLEDAVYLGQGTPDINNPLVFDQVETGGIGLVGQKAIVSYLDGHFIVGQDNIYFHSTRGFEAIGNPVLSQTIRKCNDIWRVYAVADPKRNRICFGFPGSSDYIEKVWSFDYRTGAWSYEDYNTWMIAAPLFDNSLAWNDLGGYTWDTLSTAGATWDDLQGDDDPTVDLVREYQGKLQLATTGASADSVAGAITFQLESKDHDLGLADAEKVWSRLAVKLEFLEGVAFASALDFAVEVSQNRGRTWKNVGTLRIRAGMDEGHCDFRLTGSTMRFRLTSMAQVTPYYVTEYTYSVTPLSSESHLGSQEG